MSPLTVDEMKAEIRDLYVALEESVKLQSHYARLLNLYDCGGRLDFANAQAWIDRLIDTGKMPINRRRRTLR